MARRTTEASPIAGGPGGRPATPWSGHAFGVNLRADFPVAGLAPCEPLETAAPPTSLYLASEKAIAAQWEGMSPERLIEWRDGSSVEGGLDLVPELGYRLSVEGYGTFTVTGEGHEVRCAPPDGDSNAWELCLLGQVLPLVAVLRGVEVLHASAVSLGDHAAAFVGVSTAGKTSLAVNLMTRNARLVTDDVLGLALSEEGLRCFPGAGIVSLRDAEAASMGDRWLGLGEVTARGSDSVRVVVDRDDRSLPLAALYFLDRAPRPETRIEPIASDPRLLLASSFNFVVRDRARLVNQLEVCAALSARVPQFRVLIGADTTAGALSGEILGHMDRLRVDEAA